MTTDDDGIAAGVRLLRNQGMRARYDYEMPGYNWRLTDLQAAIAIPQVNRLKEITAVRNANAASSPSGLRGTPGLLLPTVATGPEPCVAPVHGARHRGRSGQP